MSPLKVELLLWYYSRPVDYPNLSAPAVQVAINELCKAGIFYKHIDPINETQPKIGYHQSALNVYVENILAVPLPKQVWVCSNVLG